MIDGRPGATWGITVVLLVAVPVTAAWVYVLSTNALSAQTYYGLPLYLSAAGFCALVMCGAAARDQWALIVLLLVASTLLNIEFRPRDIDTGIDFENGMKIAMWLTLLAIAAANGHHCARLLTDPVLASFGAFSLAALFSATYSPVPSYTAACAIGLLSYLGFTCVVALELNERIVVRVLIGGLLVYIVANWMAAVVIPDFAFLPDYDGIPGHVEGTVFRLQGIAKHPNSLGQQVAAFMLLVIGGWQRGYIKRATGVGLLAIGFATLTAANSRTALIAVVLAWILVALKSRRLLLPTVVVGGFLFGLVMVVSSTGIHFNLETLLGSASRSGNTDEILTLTGRTDIWEIVWAKIVQHPLFGYGFSAYETIIGNEWLGGEIGGSKAAHNSWLQALFSVGVVGTIPLVIAFAVLIHRWVTRPNRFRDLFTMYLLVSGMAEAEITAVPILLTLLAFLVFALDAAGNSVRAQSVS